MSESKSIEMKDFNNLALKYPSLPIRDNESYPILNKTQRAVYISCLIESILRSLPSFLEELRQYGLGFRFNNVNYEHIFMDGFLKYQNHKNATFLIGRLSWANLSLNFYEDLLIAIKLNNFYPKTMKENCIYALYLGFLWRTDSIITLKERIFMRKLGVSDKLRNREDKMMLKLIKY